MRKIKASALIFKNVDNSELTFYNIAEVKNMSAKIDEIRELFKERTHVSEIKMDQPMTELGLDSLDVVEMCLDLEDKYGISFSTDELSSFKTVGDLFNSIEKKI